MNTLTPTQRTETKYFLLHTQHPLPGCIWWKRHVELFDETKDWRNDLEHVRRTLEIKGVHDVNSVIHERRYQKLKKLERISFDVAAVEAASRVKSGRAEEIREAVIKNKPAKRRRGGRGRIQGFAQFINCQQAD
mmetsp:Transcript_3611/g.7986  ORF Transcript_3611/g.7986 Transcript_3611/m.7986 type:complete len:134 (-) Transcript_3611:11-412(-)